MKKKLMALCLAICMAFSVMLFGCFESKNNPDASTDGTDTEQTGGNNNQTGIKKFFCGFTEKICRIGLPCVLRY